MNDLQLLYDSGQHIELLNRIKGINLDELIALESSDIIIIINVLLKYEYDQAALLIYERAVRTGAVKSNSLKNKIIAIKNFFESIKYTPTSELNALVTTSEIYAKQKFDQIRDKHTFESVNILLVISSLGPGGAERQFVNLFNHLSKGGVFNLNNTFGLVLSSEKKNGGHHLHVVAERFRANLIMGDCLEIDDLNRVQFGSAARRRAIAKIRQVVQEKKIHLAIGFLEETAVAVCMAALIDNFYAITRFGSMPTIARRELSDSAAINSLNRIATLKAIDTHRVTWGGNSRKCLTAYLRYIDYKNKINSNSTIVIPNLLHINDESSDVDSNFEKIINNKTVVISVMRLSGEKRPEFFLNLAKHFAKNNSIVFVLIGDGPLGETLFTILRSLPNLYWLKNTKNVSYYLSKSHIYVMTSIVEGSPNAVLEASYFGLASIVADVGGVSEIYTNNVDALYVQDPNVFEHYVFALGTLIESPDFRSKIGFAAKKNIQKLAIGESTSFAISLAIARLFRRDA